MTMTNRFRLFLGCFISLVAAGVGFAVRAAILEDWGEQFSLTEEQKGMILGAGLYPFAISIILFSLVIDRIGYGTSMVFAFVGHLISTLLTIFADSFEMLYAATFLFALSNGVVEAVINPVIATMYDKNKTHWLSVLHAGWPGGLIVGGLLAIVVLHTGTSLGESLPGDLWRWQMAVVLIPTVIYGLILLGQKFPVQERVAAGVKYVDMLKEFGWGSALITCFLIVAGVNQILDVAGIEKMAMGYQLLLAVVPTVLFAAYVKSFGRTMFVFLLLIMGLLATTELGTDSWISDIMRSVLGSPTLGILFLVYTSLIMFVLRFFAGPIVHKISSLGLLAVSSAIAALGLLWLANAGTGALVLFLAATFYGFGKTFFWPAMLGVVSEQYPKGGALLLNAIAGVGVLTVGIFGGPAIGTVQDIGFERILEAEQPAIHEKIVVEQEGQFFKYHAVDAIKRNDELTEDQQGLVTAVESRAKQASLGWIAILPAIMLVCYLLLIAYFKAQGGYKPVELAAGEDVRSE